MFTSVKNFIRRAWRSPVALFILSLAIFASTEALCLVPMDAIFSGAMTGIGFFEMPLAQFYLFILLAPLEILRRTGLLAYVFFFLTLGVLSSYEQALPHSRASRVFNGSLAALQLVTFVWALYRINAVASPMSALITATFPLLYGTLTILLRKTETVHLHPHGA